MQKWISKGAWNSDVEDERAAPSRAEAAETTEGSPGAPPEDDRLLLSIDKLTQEVEQSLKGRPGSPDSEDTDWEALWEALGERLALEAEVRFVAEDYERVQQDILACRSDMESLLQQIQEAKQQQQQQGDGRPEAEEAGADLPDPDPPRPKELREGSRGRKACAAEPHVETSKAQVRSEEKPRTFCQKERSKLLLEAELQQEKMKNRTAREELEKVKVSCAEEIQKYKAQLQKVRQQLESLQQVHQKDIQKALKEQSELSKQEVRKAKAAYESELQTCKDKLEDYRHQNEVLQRNLRRAQETAGRGQSSQQAPLDLQACQKDLNTFKQQMDSFRRNPRCALQSTESSLFTAGLSSTGMLSNRGLSQSFKNTEKKVRNKVLSLQSELERSRNEIRQEKELCERLQREKESIQMSYKEQQNELSYTKLHFDSMHAQLEDYKKRIESKTEEADHLRKDLKKVKKSCKKRHERKSRSRTAEGEDKSQTNASRSEEKKRRAEDDGPRDGGAGPEPPAEKKKPKRQQPQKGSAEAEGRVSQGAADPQTSPESHKSSRSPQKSTFKMVRDFFGLRKPKK